MAAPILAQQIALQLVDKGQHSSHLQLWVTVPASLVRSHCHCLIWCLVCGCYSSGPWSVAGWLSAQGGEVSSQSYHSLFLGYSGIPQSSVTLVLSIHPLLLVT